MPDQEIPPYQALSPSVRDAAWDVDSERSWWDAVLLAWSDVSECPSLPLDLSSWDRDEI